MEEIIIGLAGALIGFIGSMLLLGFNYKNLFAKTISSERVSWLKDMRELVDNLISELAKEDKSNVNQYTSKIILRLNPNNDEDLINYLKRIEANPNEANIDDIRHKFSVMFKEEWDKVKCEARGYPNPFSAHSKYNKLYNVRYVLKLIVLVVLYVILGILIWNCLVPNIKIEEVKICTWIVYGLIVGVTIINEIASIWISMEKKRINWVKVIIIGVVFVSIVLFALNLYFACNINDNANIFTAISGWVGFLATAGVGAITIYQNIRSEIKLSRQSKIKDLESFKQFIYATYNCFVSNRAITLAIEQFMNIVNVESCKNLKVNDKREDEIEQQNEILRRKIDFVLLNFCNTCECQANDIYHNLRYKFDKLAKIHNAYTGLISTITGVIASQYTEKEFEILKDALNQFSKIRNLYTELLIDIENSIQELNNIKLSDKEFENKYTLLITIKETKDSIEQNAKKYNKETQNGQAEDDVDGQGK